MEERRSLLDPLERWEPQRIGPFAILGRLGTGSMGRVYLGRSAAGRLVAVKTIRLELVRESDFLTRFAHEVAAARRVSGVFTAAVVAADPEAKEPWLATAYVPAPSLEQLVKVSGNLPVPAVRWLAAGCAEALDAIHTTGLVHRDLKPSNVLVALDGPRVIDFGLARALERIQMTITRVAIGTPAYMAPEQAQGPRHVTAASDVYSLGSTLLFAATGHGPYQGETVMELMARLATQPPDLGGLPDDLFDLVSGCLERKASQRPSPAEIVASLAAHVDLGSGPEPGRSYLPDAALSVVMDYRQGPRLPITEPVAEFEDAEVSHPSRSERSASTISSVARRGSAFSAILAAGVVAVLVGTGALLGLAFDRDGGRPPAGQQQGQPPRRGAPPPPLSGANDVPTGPPKIVVNQPEGDLHTVFVLHGTGWPPGGRVSIRLDRVTRAAEGPFADRKGTFNYAINQGHEFFPGPLAVGGHRVAATLAGRSKPRAETTFVVLP